MIPCKRCCGTGKTNTPQEDVALGEQLRTAREKAKKSLRETAGKMTLSPTYLSRLENGRERWNPDLEKRYRAAIGEG